MEIIERMGNGVKRRFNRIVSPVIILMVIMSSGVLLLDLYDIPSHIIALLGLSQLLIIVVSVIIIGLVLAKNNNLFRLLPLKPFCWVDTSLISGTISGIILYFMECFMDLGHDYKYKLLAALVAVCIFFELARILYFRNRKEQNKVTDQETVFRNEEIIDRVINYLEEKVSTGAIMLNGDWGIGKTYFIEHSLREAIEKRQFECVIVSLYGISMIDELSKSIFLEAHFHTRDKMKGETEKISAVIGKTIIRNLASLKRIDLSISDKDLCKIYEAVDFTRKLIVLEDVERTGIDLSDLLGFVNDLSENNKAKVLLVANEKEFIKVEEPVGNSKDDKKRYSSETEKYLCMKEKTISDTLLFVADSKIAVAEILSEYKNTVLERFKSDEAVQKIIDIMDWCECYNLRSFIYVCQKSKEILEKFNETDINLISDPVFYGTLSYVLRRNSGNEINWTNEYLYSDMLGTMNYPFLQLCYDYIEGHVWKKELVEETLKALNDRQVYNRDKSNDDKDIAVLRDYFRFSEKEIKEALENITTKLKNPEDISFHMYGDIAIFSIKMKELLGVDIEKIKEALIQNLRGRGNKITRDYVFYTRLGDWESEEVKNEYKELEENMCKAIEDGSEVIPCDEYELERIEGLYSFVLKNRGKFHAKGRFIGYFDMNKLFDVYEKSKPAGKNSVRASFMAVYRDAERLMKDDLDEIKAFYGKLQDGINEFEGDPIDKLQYEWFSDFLKVVIAKMER